MSIRTTNHAFIAWCLAGIGLVAVLDHQLAIHEPPAGDELEDVVTIATDQPLAKVIEDCFELGARIRGMD